jgi:hypothetical protein
MLRRSFYKKLLPTGQLSASQIDKATVKFLAANDRISTTFEFLPKTTEEDLFWDYFRDHVDKTLCSCEADYSLESLRGTFAVGPGAAIGADSESFYTKLFGSTLTATSSHLLTLYRGLLSESDTWSFAEMQRFQVFGFKEVAGSRLFFVPKDEATARTCCTEPNINMLMQKALGGIFEKRLLDCFGISLDKQADANRQLARIGSLDNSFATIDLESASDSISWALVQRVLRGRALGLVSLFRSPTTRLPDGSELELKMVSTMGNGFTFPLMTILFCCAVRAVYDIMGLRSDARKLDFAVFGDDIIVRRETYSFLVSMLGKLGFRVNEAKSFFVGPFRESCGHDYWCGTYVRGIYIRSLETHASVYSALNRLTRWSALSGISLKNVLTYLISRVKGRLLLVPPSESWEAGLHVPFRLTIPRVTDSYWFSYRKLVAQVRRRRVPKDQDEAKKLHYLFHNSNGVALAFLGGYARTSDNAIMPKHISPGGDCVRVLSDAYFMLREDGNVVRYRVRPSTIPYWDWLGAQACAFRGAGMSHDAWERTVAAIL